MGGEIALRKKIVHGLTAAAVLANAAAAFGRPEDIDMLESKIPSQDLKTRVFLRYCWSKSPQNFLRTILRFYKALACKNEVYSRAMKVAQIRIAGAYSVQARVAHFGRFQRS
jgi:hypothetical protein